MALPQGFRSCGRYLKDPRMGDNSVKFHYTMVRDADFLVSLQDCFEKFPGLRVPWTVGTVRTDQDVGVNCGHYFCS